VCVNLQINLDYLGNSFSSLQKIKKSSWNESNKSICMYYIEVKS